MRIYFNRRNIVFKYHICDWVSENGPSGHTNFDHIFHICCIITNDLLKLYQLRISQVTFYSLKKANIVHRTQDMYHFVISHNLCPFGPFLLARSHIRNTGCIITCFFNLIMQGIVNSITALKESRNRRRLAKEKEQRLCLDKTLDNDNDNIINSACINVVSKFVLMSLFT